MTPSATSRRILLHVGSPKCGSTYLQKVLLRAAPMLLDHGIRYPHDGGNHPGNAAKIEFLDRATLDGHFADEVHTVILSHEDIYSGARRAGALARMTHDDGTAVQVLAFLRPFSEFVFGDYSQFMKQFFEQYLATRTPYNGQDFTAFALRRAPSLDPARFLSNWQSRFPDTPVILAGHRDIPAVMTRLLGTKVPIDWDLPVDQANPSLRIEDCQQIAQAMHDQQLHDEAIREMFREAFQKVDQPDAGRTRERVEMIEKAFARQNRDLLDTFGYDNRLRGPKDASRA